MADILIVGAGLAGAVHARELADQNFNVTVLDRRNHIAGNCYDYIHPCGVRTHKYGPHLFHTSNQRVVDWLSRFTTWLPYEHEVVARLPSGHLSPMPINLDTVNAVFGTEECTPQGIEALLKEKSVQKSKILNAEDHLLSQIGPELTDLFFRRYTKKMWGTELSDMDASVVKRLKIRTDRNRRYFLDDSFQAMPADGYTTMFERILGHDKIEVRLETSFDIDWLDRFEFCFNSMPIDEFYDFEFGELPYRSIKFYLETVSRSEAEDHAVINYTDSGPFTRETWWHNIAGHCIEATDKVLRTVEEPCDYRDNNFERYYPVKSSDGRYQDLYSKYVNISKNSDRIKFIGRCGTYQYLDMHQVVNQSLKSAKDWMERTP